MSPTPEATPDRLAAVPCAQVAARARDLAAAGRHLGAAERARLTGCIADAEPAAQSDLAAALVAGCPPADLPEVARALLHDRSDFVRDAASDALAALLHAGPPPARAAATEALRAALDDEHRDVRWYATEALAREQAPQAIPLLVARLHDDEFSIRWTAGNGLIEAGAGAIVPVLRALAEDEPSPLFATAARRVLSRVAAAGDLDATLRELVDRMGRSTSIYDVQPLAVEVMQRLRGDRPADPTGPEAGR